MARYQRFDDLAVVGIELRKMLAIEPAGVVCVIAGNEHRSLARAIHRDQHCATNDSTAWVSADSVKGNRPINRLDKRKRFQIDAGFFLELAQCAG